MSGSLGNLTVDLSANVAKFESDLGKAQTIAQRAAASIGGLLKSVAPALSIGAGAAFLKNAIDSAAATQRMADRIGVAVEDLSVLASVAKQAQTPIEDVEASMGKFAVKLADAAGGSVDAQRTLRALGVDTEALAAKQLTMIEALDQVGKTLGNSEASFARTAAARELFGKGGAAMIPVLQKMGAGFEELRIKAEQAGKIIREDVGRGAIEVEENLKKLRGGTGALTIGIASELVPALLDITRAFKDLKSGTQDTSSFFTAIAEGLRIVVAVGTGAVTVLQSVAKIFIGGQLAFIELLKGNGSRAYDEITAAALDLEAFAQARAKTIKGLFASSHLFGDPDLHKGIRGPGGGAPIVSKDDAGALAKKVLAGELKVLEHFRDSEREVLESRNQTTAAYLEQNAIGFTRSFEVRRAALDEYIERVRGAFDQESGLLAKARAKFAKLEDRQEIDNKLQESLAKRNKFETEAARSSLTLYFEENKAIEQLARSVQELDAALAEAQGDIQKAAEIRFGVQWRDSYLRLLAEGRYEDGLKIARLRELTVAQAGLNEITARAGIVQEQLANAEARIDIDRRLGAASELDSLRRLGEVREQSLAKLRTEADEMERIARAANDPRMIQNAENFRVRLEQLAADAQVLRRKFDEIGESAFGDFLSDVVSRTKSVSDAFTDMVRNIEREISRLAGQDLAKKIFGAAGGASGGGFGGVFAGLFGGSGRPLIGETLPPDVFGPPTPGLLDGILGIFGGGLASGGLAERGKVYSIAEQFPEVLAANGQTYLVMGNSNGQVTPLSSGGGNTINVNVQGAVDRRTGQQVALEASRYLSRAASRNG